jgi:subtilisin family serine protease
MLKPRLLTATLLLLLFSTSSALGADKLRRYPRGVKNAYIVDVENKSTENVIRVAELARKQYKAKVTSVFTEIYGGFAIEAPESTALLLSHLPEVRAVHEVTEGWVTEAPVARTLSAQSWGLDRIDQRESIAGGDGRYTYYYRGDDVTVYVVDTGVDAVGDLQGRIDMHYTFDNDGDTQDCYGPGGGHGTKVASTIGGADFGVAKGVKMISVRAGCGQTPEIRSDQVVRGLAWITARHNSIQGALSVVNISWGIRESCG